MANVSSYLSTASSLLQSIQSDTNIVYNSTNPDIQNGLTLLHQSHAIQTTADITLNVASGQGASVLPVAENVASVASSAIAIGAAIAIAIGEAIAIAI